ncbi:MAG: hypothetical protein H5T95_07245 [Firmicutes bacterium]|nr:hypothetical protein [Bacillota bacterium]
MSSDDRAVRRELPLAADGLAEQLLPSGNPWRRVSLRCGRGSPSLGCNASDF